MDLSKLNKRELEVLSYIKQGWTNMDIAKKLKKSYSYVKTWHMTNIYKKLGIEGAKHKCKILMAKLLDSKEI